MKQKQKQNHWQEKKDWGGHGLVILPPFLSSFSDGKGSMHRCMGQGGTLHGVQDCGGSTWTYFSLFHLFHVSFVCWLMRYFGAVQQYLTKRASNAVLDLLPPAAEGELASVCSWADQVRFRYRWASPLHYANTPGVCNFKYSSELNSHVASFCTLGCSMSIH